MELKERQKPDEGKEKKEGEWWAEEDAIDFFLMVIAPAPTKANKAKHTFHASSKSMGRIM